MNFDKQGNKVVADKIANGLTEWIADQDLLGGFLEEQTNGQINHSSVEIRKSEYGTDISLMLKDGRLITISISVEI